jgi:hypothetical protein
VTMHRLKPYGLDYAALPTIPRRQRIWPISLLCTSFQAGLMHVLSRL